MVGIAFAGWVFTTLSVIAAIFQLALVAGAPWGEYTMGGQIKGQLPKKRRFAAFFQSLLLVYFSIVIAMNAGIIEMQERFFGINLWIIVAFFGLGTIANIITPSKKERMIWAPVNIIMLFCAIYISLKA